MIHDVLIVGAGPAGSLLATLLARSGRRVALIDKARFPRDKVCGGGLSNKTVQLLGRHGIAIDDIVHRRMKGCYLAYRNRDPVVRELDREVAAITVLRSEFDHLLLAEALAAGAEFHPGCSFLAATPGDPLSIQTSGGAFRARYLVGADGVASQVRRRWFGRGRVPYAPALEALVEVEPGDAARFDDRAVFDFGAIPAGYGWIFPKRDHLNVGVFSPFGAKDLRGHLDAFLGSYASLRQAKVRKYLGFAIPCRPPARRIERDNVWLVGDAAGFAESLFGEGIYFALWSAEIAAGCLLARLAGEASSYTAAARRQGLFTALRYAWRNSRLLYAAPEFAFYHMVRDETINLLFADLLTGRSSYRGCFFRSLARLPQWAFARPSAARLPSPQSLAAGAEPSGRFYAETEPM